MFFLYRPGEGALCSIPIENILAVERLEEESFKMKNVRSPNELWAEMQSSKCVGCCLTSCLASQMFQVIQPERALYIQANNCVEARDWIDILTKVSQCNRKRLSTYHPSAYLNGHWLCCKLSADTAPGCTPCTGYVSGGQILSSNTCLSFTRALSSFHLFPVVYRQTSSWTWMETERPRGFIPCSARTCPK